jgi:hypothetical protein
MERKRVVEIAPRVSEFTESHKEQGVAPNEPRKGCIQERYNRKQDKRSHSYIQRQERVWYTNTQLNAEEGRKNGLEAVGNNLHNQGMKVDVRADGEDAGEKAGVGSSRDEGLVATNGETAGSVRVDLWAVKIREKEERG